jgi:hypothetical protein
MHIIIIPDKRTDRFVVDREREKFLTNFCMELEDVNRVTIIRDFEDTMKLDASIKS